MKHDHATVLKRVRAALPSDTLLAELADLFKVFGDTTRMKILYLLFESELCVCAISELLCMEQSAISHQLGKLRAANLVKCRRAGKTVFYSLADEHVHSILATGSEHIME